LKCPGCKSEVPDNSVFCLSCGRPIKEEGLEPIEPPSGSKTETKSTLLLMLAIMAWFFGFFLLIPAFFIQSIPFFLVCTAVIVVGALMLVARFVILRRYSEKVEELRKEASEKIKCQYCGSMNPLDAEECVGCQAPL
jgi:ribosomal protein L40E